MSDEELSLVACESEGLAVIDGRLSLFDAAVAAMEERLQVALLLDKSVGSAEGE